METNQVFVSDGWRIAKPIEERNGYHCAGEPTLRRFKLRGKDNIFAYVPQQRIYAPKEIANRGIAQAVYHDRHLRAQSDGKSFDLTIEGLKERVIVEAKMSHQREPVVALKW